MDERDWLILRALYEHKNITKAAQELYMSQPALTNRLKDIEEKFKVKIAMRGRRGVHFTPQGEYLANYADQIILNLRRIKENVLNFDKNIGGTLRIGTSRLAAKYQLPKILRLFRNEYPEVDFKVIATWSRNIPNYLKSEEVHIGIFRGEQYWPDEKHLLSEEKICIASKNRIKLQDLPNLPRIDFETDSLLQVEIDNWWKRNYTQPPQISMEVDQVDTCKEMVINGLGYAILPNIVVQGVKDIDTMDIFNEDGQPITRRTWMAYQKKSTDINAVRVFVDFVKSKKF
ncbi:MAG: LysR family transcriptional regulator [Gracilibacter sp. BRH_c7a]|nr:MAG: LysR family transcriptional regulator [Gracilibacter sp. BRH_c7a]